MYFHEKIETVVFASLFALGTGIIENSFVVGVFGFMLCMCTFMLMNLTRENL